MQTNNDAAMVRGRVTTGDPNCHIQRIDPTVRRLAAARARAGSPQKEPLADPVAKYAYTIAPPEILHVACASPRTARSGCR